jgi:uncharacterized protein YkwD
MLLRYRTVIGFGRGSAPLLVGMSTGALLVGVVAVIQPAERPPVQGELLGSGSTAPAAAPGRPLSPPVSPPTSAAAAPSPAPAARAAAVAGAARPAPATSTTAQPTTTRPTTTRPTPAATRPAPAEPQAAPADTSQTGQVVALTNQARAAAGCAALRTDARLTAAAQGHSADMAANDYFSHDGRDGRGFAKRITDQGYPSPGGENIAQGQRNAQEVVTAWLSSPGHRANIENCSFTTIGVGLAGADKYWTQNFGR